MGSGQGLGSAASQAVGLDLAKAFWPDMWRTQKRRRRPRMESEGCVFRLDWLNHLGVITWDRAGIKAGRRRTKELPGGLETLRTTASLHYVGAMSPFPGYTAKRRDGQERRAGLSSVSSFCAALLIN